MILRCIHNLIWIKTLVILCVISYHAYAWVFKCVVNPQSVTSRILVHVDGTFSSSLHSSFHASIRSVHNLLCVAEHSQTGRGPRVCPVGLRAPQSGHMRPSETGECGACQSLHRQPHVSVSDRCWPRPHLVKRVRTARRALPYCERTGSGGGGCHSWQWPWTRGMTLERLRDVDDGYDVRRQHPRLDSESGRKDGATLREEGPRSLCETHDISSRGMEDCVVLIDSAGTSHNGLLKGVRKHASDHQEIGSEH